jgi:dolichol-phosphate mannosyltransferase
VAALEPFGLTVGFLFVDDGSRDETVAILQALGAKDPRVRHLSFTRNFGHQAALLAGLEHSTGDCVVTMDGDLQHPPYVVPELVRHWLDGVDIVVTSRELGKSMGAFKRAATLGFYAFMNRISGLQLPPGAADFRLLDRRAVETIVAFPERQKFLRGLTAWTGYRSATVIYQVGERHSGQAKYTLRSLARLALNGITSFSAKPLRLAFYMGLIIFALASAYGVVAIAAHLMGYTPPGWTSVLVSVLAIGGLQMTFIGLIGEYLARVFDEVKRRPYYLLKAESKPRPRPKANV